MPSLSSYSHGTAVLRITLSDITRRKEAVEALRQSELRERENRFRKMFIHHSAAMLILDIKTGRIVDANYAAARFYGWSLDELKKMNIQEINTLPSEPLWDFLGKAAGPNGIKAEFCHRRADGSIRDVEVFSNGIESAGKKFLVSIVHDITERKRSEEKIRQMNLELERRVDVRTRQLQELAMELLGAEDRERERLAHVLHDELQQKLAAIRMYMQILVPKASQDSHYQGKFNSAISLIDDTIAETRSLSRKLYPTTLRMHGLLSAFERLVDDMQREHALKVRLELAPEAEVRDERMGSMVYRAVNELLFNVVKHSGISEARVTARRVGDELRFCVSDQGRGGDPAEVHARTQDFMSLGLPSIKERIGYLGGSLEIDTALEKGFSVTLVLPAPKEIEAAASPDTQRADQEIAAADSKEPASDRRITILLVDDHHLMRDALATTLAQEQEFHVVGQAADGNQALQYVSELDPDVILMDVNMPGMNGIETTAKIREQFSRPTIIGLTMHHDPTTVEKLRQAGAVDVLEKSSTISRLSAAIRKHAGSHL